MSNVITTAAPRGLRCSRCLCCEAVLVFEFEGKREALCAACDDGTHPPLPEYNAAPAIDLPAPRLEPLIVPTAKRPASTIQMADTSSSLQLGKESPKVNIDKRHCGQRIGDAMKLAILAEPPSMSAAEVGRMYGVSDVSVSKFRREAGIKSHTKPGPKAAATLTARRTAKGWEPDPEARLPRSWPITVNVTDKTIEDWWRSLTPDVKTELFAGNYVIRVEGAVS
jgi:hypothetical protein